VLLEEVRQVDVNENRRVAAHRLSEVRAMTTGGGATASAAGGGGAALVAPAFLDDLFAPFLQRSVFVEECNGQPLPEFGLHVYLPQITSDAGMAQQVTEGDSVTETDPGMALLGTQLETISGEVIVSQQLFDRSGGPGSGVTVDTVIAKQLGLDFAAKVDVYVLATALATAA